MGRSFVASAVGAVGSLVLAVGACGGGSRDDFGSSHDAAVDAIPGDDVLVNSLVDAAPPPDPCDPPSSCAEAGYDCTASGSCPPDTGLVAYYPFTGDLKDRSPSKADGNGHNATLAADRHGNGSSALHLDANLPSWMDTPNPYLPLGNKPRTLALWVHTTHGSGFKTAANWGSDSDGKRFGLSIHDTKDTFTSQGSDIDGSVNVADGNWHHLAVTYDGADAVLYVDGKVDKKKSYGSLSTSGQLFVVGLKVSTTSDELFSGELDEIRVYDRALSASDVTALYRDDGGP